MNKDQKTVVAEYVSSVSEDTLQFLNTRLTEKLFGDLAEALEEMSKDKRMDNILSDASSSESVFNLLDEIKDVVYKECKKKGLLLKSVVSAA
jgi:CRISPR/Cas system-associated endonuclease/helicase Cas3